MRADKIETERRVFTVIEWIIDGIPSYQLEKKVKEEFEVEIRQARRYIKKAYEIWKENNEVELIQKRNSRIDELKNDINSMEERYKKTPAGLKAILAVKKEITKLEGLYPAKHIKISGDQQNPVVVQTSPFVSEKDEQDYSEYLRKKYNFKK